MSSVLIKGMEIPKRCFECPCCQTVGYFTCMLMAKDLRKEHGINISRPDWCPLVEIPTPHGRLIDADMLKSKFRHGKGDDDVDSAWISTIRRFITQADTIIGAEGSKE